jgi:hypothetical protein
MKNKLSKQAVLLIFAGNLFITLPYLVNKLIPLPEDLADFFKGFGVAVMIMALVTSKKPGRSKCTTS